MQMTSNCLNGMSEVMDLECFTWATTYTNSISHACCQASTAKFKA